MKSSHIDSQGSLILLVVSLILVGTVGCVSGRIVLLGLSLLSFAWLAGKGRGAFFSGSAIIFVLMLVYYFNPTHRWAEGVGALPIHHIRFLPGSAFPEGTKNSALFIITALSATGLAMRLARKEHAILLTVISVVGALTALAALGQRLTPRLFPVFEATGFFAYENHFAAFANLVLPVALTCGLRAQIRAFQAGKVSSPAGLYYWTALLLGVAIVLSRSRAGVLVTGLILAAVSLLVIRLRRRAPFILPPPLLPARVGWGLAATAAGAFLFAAVFFVGQGFCQIKEQLMFRWQIIVDALSAFKDHPCWGTGPGTFAAIFPYYQSSAIENHFFSHAHCEPVEFLTEYGLLGSGIVLAGVAWILFSSPRRGRPNQKTPSFLELEGFGLVLALIGIGLHGLVDFPFRHPLNALLTVVWIAILAGRLKLKDGSTPAEPESSKNLNAEAQGRRGF